MWFRDRVRRRAWVALCACVVAFSAPGLAGAAGSSRTGPDTATTEPAGDPVAQLPGAPAVVTVANRPIATIRAEAQGASPAERAEAIEFRLAEIIKHGGPFEVTTRTHPDGVTILVDGKIAFRVLAEDVDGLAGQTLGAVAADAADNLRTALAEVREAEDTQGLLKSAGYALLATAIFVLLAWLLFRGYQSFARHVNDFVHRRLTHLLPSWTSQVVGEAALGGLFKLPLKLIAILLGVLVTYEWAAFVLLRFPYTRPLGESLRDDLLAGLGRFGASMLEAVPGLLFVVLIILLARIAVRAVRAFFNGVERGFIHVSALDESTARPTGKLVTTGIWLLAMVAAYPYIPGSSSEAFKGIGVFVGLMMSIGASGVVSQLVSGLMLMYTRALKPGEFVQIGETEGTVKSVGFISTRIETLRREEVNVPNSVIATSVTRNYSRLADAGRRVGSDQGDDRIRHAVAAGEGDARAGGGPHRRRPEGARAPCAADRTDGLLRRVHAAGRPCDALGEDRHDGRAARQHPGRVQRVRRADHVAQLPQRP